LTLEERVAQAVEQHRDELAELVARAVDAELERLIEANVAARLNGHAEPTETKATVATAETKICSGCGRVLPLSKFDGQRRLCNTCRSRQQQERRRQRQASGDDGSAEEP